MPISYNRSAPPTPFSTVVIPLTSAVLCCSERRSPAAPSGRPVSICKERPSNLGRALSFILARSCTGPSVLALVRSALPRCREGMRAMKIALVSPYDYPYPGGVTAHIHHLDEEFSRVGHVVKVIAPSSSAEDVLERENVLKLGS